MKYILHLAHGQNVDLMWGQGNGSGYRQSPEDPHSQTITVSSLKEASERFSEWITRNGLGAGNLARNAGTITEAKSKKVIACVSYNGRVWDLDDNEILID